MQQNFSKRVFRSSLRSIWLLKKVTHAEARSYNTKALAVTRYNKSLAPPREQRLHSLTVFALTFKPDSPKTHM